MPRMWGSSNKFAPRRKRQVVSDAGCVRTHRTFVRSLHKRRRSDTPCSGQLIAIAFCSIGVLVVTAVQNLNSHSRSVSLSASSANVNGKCARIHTDDTRVLLGLENFCDLQDRTGDLGCTGICLSARINNAHLPITHLRLRWSRACGLVCLRVTRLSDSLHALMCTYSCSHACKWMHAVPEQWLKGISAAQVRAGPLGQCGRREGKHGG